MADLFFFFFLFPISVVTIEELRTAAWNLIYVNRSYT
jgi:hypothetical protein